MAHPPLGRQSLGVELVDYVPSGVASIVQAVVDVPVLPDDVFVDVGAGLGKVTALVHMLSGATARGLELQPSLVDHATRATSQLGLDDVAFEQVDARHADFADASIVFLYLPFVGDALRDVLERLESSRRRAVVLCTLGLDLGHVPWLRARQGEDVWLSIYDTVHGNGRSARAPSPLARIARSVT
jgi:SAM-dependent methyltransferase